MNILLLRKSFLTLDGKRARSIPKPSLMPAACSQAKPSFEPGALYSPGSTGPISIVPGGPRDRSWLISRIRSDKICANAKNFLMCFGNLCDFVIRSSGIVRSPHRERKNMSAATNTKKPTAATSETINEFFHEAMRSYERAMKSGIQLQEESVNLWRNLLTKLDFREELQAKFESMTADVFPKARERMKEFLETFGRRSKQTINLFGKTLGVYQATSVTDAQRRVQDLIESSRAALRVNVHSALDANAKIIASWKGLADRCGPAVKQESVIGEEKR
jgi:hypothetical protein